MAFAPTLRRLAAAGAGVLLALLATAGQAAVPVERLRVPPGFRIELVTDAVPNARAMTLGRFVDGRGVVYVGSMGAGSVYAVELDQGRARAVHIVASGLALPAGIAWRDGRLYVSALSRILRFDGIDDRLANPPPAVVVNDRLPGESHHGAKFIAFGPDGRLYLAVGAPCNVCKPDARHGNLQRMNADGSGLEVVATGIRNSVGFDWNPVDKTLWFTDNGRDMLGDDLPSDELNRLDEAGPGLRLSVLPPGRHAPIPNSAASAPAANRRRRSRGWARTSPRSACASTPGAQFPESYRRSIFIAEHGSWNRSRKVGYRVVRIGLDAAGKVERDEPFVEGWLQLDAVGRESVWGRPADVLPLPDGSLLISDDTAGAIYRVVYASGGG